MQNSEYQIVRMSPWILLYRLLLAELLFVASLFIFKYLSEVVINNPETWIEALGIWILMAQGIEIIVLVCICFVWSNTIYGFSKKTITKKTGVLMINQNTYNTSNIESVKVKQRLFGVLFKFGSVYLSAPTLKETVVIKGVSNPRALAEKIEYYMEESAKNTIVPVKV